MTGWGEGKQKRAERDRTCHAVDEAGGWIEMGSLSSIQSDFLLQL